MRRNAQSETILQCESTTSIDEIPFLVLYCLAAHDLIVLLSLFKYSKYRDFLYISEKFREYNRESESKRISSVCMQFCVFCHITSTKFLIALYWEDGKSHHFRTHSIHSYKLGRRNSN
jgi:hypothetical protein